MTKGRAQGARHRPQTRWQEQKSPLQSCAGAANSARAARGVTRGTPAPVSDDAKGQATAGEFYIYTYTHMYMPHREPGGRLGEQTAFCRPSAGEQTRASRCRAGMPQGSQSPALPQGTPSRGGYLCSFFRPRQPAGDGNGLLFGVVGLVFFSFSLFFRSVGVCLLFRSPR